MLIRLTNSPTLIISLLSKILVIFNIICCKILLVCYTVIVKESNCGDSAKKKLTPFLHQKLWGCSSAWLERLPVTQEAAGSSPVTPAKINA